MPLAEVEKIVTNGHALFHYDNKVHFVDYALDREVIEFSVIKEKKNYNIAKIEKILKESEYRIKPICNKFYLCGGCDFQYMVYKKEVQVKRDILIDNIKRIAKIDKKNIRIFSNDNPLFYRNKIILFSDGKIFGLYAKKTHKVIKIDKCYLQIEGINKIISILNSKYNHLAKFFCCLKIIQLQAKVLVVFYYESKLDKFVYDYLKEFPSDIVYICKKIKGNYVSCQYSKFIRGDSKYLDVKIDDFTFFVDYNSFFQVNIFQLKNIYRVLYEYKDIFKDKIIIDLYSGVGVFSFLFSKWAKLVYSVENNLNSTSMFLKTKQLYNNENIKLIEKDVLDSLDILSSIDIDILFLDPPRKGIDKELIDFILRKNIKKIFYLSCNSATLARDFNLLKNKYKLKRVYLFDMFARTWHFETLFVLNLK